MVWFLRPQPRRPDKRGARTQPCYLVSIYSQAARPQSRGRLPVWRWTGCGSPCEGRSGQEDGRRAAPHFLLCKRSPLLIYITRPRSESVTRKYMSNLKKPGHRSATAQTQLSEGRDVAVTHSTLLNIKQRCINTPAAAILSRAEALLPLASVYVTRLVKRYLRGKKRRYSNILKKIKAPVCWK